MEFYPFYFLLRPVVHTVTNAFYKKIQFRNKEELSVKDRPVLIAMNHPNSFMDPMSFASNVRPKLFFLARGDSFKKSTARILHSAGIIPIFRPGDGGSGREGMIKNDATFKIVKAHLKKKHSVIIFAEGICIQERRLRPLKKGCARMAFDAYTDMKDPNMVVLPVGANYQNNPSKFRHDVFYIIGEPIKVADYFKDTDENSVKGINRLTLDVQAAMKKTLIHIDHPENDRLIEQLEEVCMEEFLEEEGKDSGDLDVRHEWTKKLVERVNAATTAEPEKISLLRDLSQRYTTHLTQLKLRDKLLRKGFESMSGTGMLLIKTVLFLAGIPLWIAAVVTNYLPYFGSWKIAHKLIKDIEWYASVAALLGIFLFGLYYIGQYIFVWLYFDDWRILLAYLPVPFILGYFALYYSPFRKKLFGGWRYRGLKNKADLLKMRNSLVTDVHELLK